MARRNLSAHVLSDLSYHEFFDAVTVVAARSNISSGDDDEDTVSDVRWVLTSPNSGSPQTEESKSSSVSSTMKQRKGKSSDNDTEDTAVKTDPVKQQQQQLDLQNSTIMWFSSLPPSDLRQAQKNFRSGKNGMASEIVCAY